MCVLFSCWLGDCFLQGSTQHSTSNQIKQTPLHQTKPQQKQKKDIARVARDTETYVKLPLRGAVARWLGEGLATTADPVRHAAARAVLQPGFKPEAIRAHCRGFAGVAAELADVLLESGGAPVGERLFGCAGFLVFVSLVSLLAGFVAGMGGERPALRRKQSNNTPSHRPPSHTPTNRRRAAAAARHGR